MAGTQSGPPAQRPAALTSWGGAAGVQGLPGAQSGPPASRAAGPYSTGGAGIPGLAGGPSGPPARRDPGPGPGTGAGAGGGGGPQTARTDGQNNNNGFKYFDKNPLTGRQTAGAAGIKPEFKVASDVNWKMMDAEYLARLNQAYRAAPDSVKKDFEMTSGYRPTERKEATDLGMSPHTSQRDVWERHIGVAPTAPGYNRPSAAARPGHSRHEFSKAGDFRVSTADWLRRHTEFGITGIGGDPPHIQMIENGRNALADEIKLQNAHAPPANSGATSAGATPATATGPQKTMLFLHGMESRYKDTSVSSVEASARKYAEANGYKLEVIDVSGDNKKQQIEAARARLSKGGVAGMLGFSAGGYTADKLRKEYPNLDYHIVGAPGVTGDQEVSGVRHMGQVEAIAARAAARAAANKVTTATNVNSAADRATVDAASAAKAVRTVKVSSGGSLIADVSAPANTSVSVSGTGGFSRTETNRTIPMNRENRGAAGVPGRAGTPSGPPAARAPKSTSTAPPKEDLAVNPS